MPDTRSTASSSRGRPDGRGRHVAAAARARGLIPVALARDAGRARDALLDVEIAVGDLEDAGSLVDPVRDIDAIIFVHGSDADSRQDSVQRIDYDGVLNTLQALGERTPRIVLRSSSRGGDNSLNSGAYALDWKRRSERLVRLSGAPYTIVRPGWLDDPAGAHVTIEQGDTGEGSIAREVLAHVHIRGTPARGRDRQDLRGLLGTPKRPPATGSACSGRRGPTPAEPSTR